MDTVNSDLADTLGNLLLRITSKRLATVGADSGSPGLRYQGDKFPLTGHTLGGGASTKDLELISSLHKLPGIAGSTLAR